MAKGGGKQFKSKSASAQAIKPGPSGQMHKFAGVGPEEPGQTARKQHPGKGAAFPKGGPSGKMRKFTPVKPQKSGRSSQG